MLGDEDQGGIQDDYFGGTSLVMLLPPRGEGGLGRTAKHVYSYFQN